MELFLELNRPLCHQGHKAGNSAVSDKRFNRAAQIKEPKTASIYCCMYCYGLAPPIACFSPSYLFFQSLLPAIGKLSGAGKS
ncbi:unnamed protein product [Merluccius merluccius]